MQSADDEGSAEDDRRDRTSHGERHTKLSLQEREPAFMHCKREFAFDHAEPLMGFERTGMSSMLQTCMFNTLSGLVNPF